MNNTQPTQSAPQNQVIAPTPMPVSVAGLANVNPFVPEQLPGNSEDIATMASYLPAQVAEVLTDENVQMDLEAASFSLNGQRLTLGWPGSAQEGQPRALFGGSTSPLEDGTDLEADLMNLPEHGLVIPRYVRLRFGPHTRGLRVRDARVTASGWELLLEPFALMGQGSEAVSISRNDLSFHELQLAAGDLGSGQVVTGEFFEVEEALTHLKGKRSHLMLRTGQQATRIKDVYVQDLLITLSTGQRPERPSVSAEQRMLEQAVKEGRMAFWREQGQREGLIFIGNEKVTITQPGISPAARQELQERHGHRGVPCVFGAPTGISGEHELTFVELAEVELTGHQSGETFTRPYPKRITTPKRRGSGSTVIVTELGPCTAQSKNSWTMTVAERREEEFNAWLPSSFHALNDAEGELRCYYRDEFAVGAEIVKYQPKGQAQELLGVLDASLTALEPLFERCGLVIDDQTLNRIANLILRHYKVPALSNVATAVGEHILIGSLNRQNGTWLAVCTHEEFRNCFDGVLTKSRYNDMVEELREKAYETVEVPSSDEIASALQDTWGDTF